MEEKKIKINYTVSQTTKDIVDKLKKQEKLNLSQTLDTLLKFDNESAKLFLELFLKNNPQIQDSDKNFIGWSNLGGYLLNGEGMKKVADSKILEKSYEDIIATGMETEKRKFDSTINKLELEDRFYNMETVVLSCMQRVKELEKKLNN